MFLSTCFGQNVLPRLFENKQRKLCETSLLYFGFSASPSFADSSICVPVNVVFSELRHNSSALLSPLPVIKTTINAAILGFLLCVDNNLTYNEDVVLLNLTLLPITSRADSHHIRDTRKFSVHNSAVYSTKNSVSATLLQFTFQCKGEIKRNYDGGTWARVIYNFIREYLRKGILVAEKNGHGDDGMLLRVLVQRSDNGMERSQVALQVAP